MTTKSPCSNVWVYLAGVLAGVVLLGLFFLVPFLLALPAVTGIWTVLLIIVVVLVVILALAVIVSALLRLLRALSFLS